ncbi:MAG: hypothetical protein V3W28_01370 [Thermoplasmata archaeon]
MARVAYDLGGTASSGLIADKIGMSEGGGAFQGRLSSTVKYGLITRKGDSVSTTGLATEIFTAYSEDEKRALQAKAFLNVPLFRDIHERFSQTRLDLGIFEKILVREYSVDQKLASSVARYFVRSAEQLGIMNADGTFRPVAEQSSVLMGEDRSGSGSKTGDRSSDKSQGPPGTEELGRDIFDALLLAGALQPNLAEQAATEMKRILDREEALSHTSLVFSLLEEEIGSGELSTKSAEVLTEALRKDLDVGEEPTVPTDEEPKLADELDSEPLEQAEPAPSAES